MIITKEEAVNLLANANNLLKDNEKNEEHLIDSFVDELVSPDKPPLQREGNEFRKIPPIFREIIALQANAGATATSIAKAYGVDNGHVGRLANGRVNKEEVRTTQTDVDLTKALESSLAIVRDRALDKIVKSIDYIRDEALELEAPKTLSMIAANLSRVVSSTMRDKQQFNQTNVQTIFYSPKGTDLGQYDVIDVESR